MSFISIQSLGLEHFFSLIDSKLAHEGPSVDIYPIPYDISGSMIEDTRRQHV